MSDARRQVGWIGLYDDPDSLIRAAETVRDAGYRHGHTDGCGSTCGQVLTRDAVLLRVRRPA